MIHKYIIAPVYINLQEYIKLKDSKQSVIASIT